MRKRRLAIYSIAERAFAVHAKKSALYTKTGECAVYPQNATGAFLEKSVYLAEKRECLFAAPQKPFVSDKNRSCFLSLFHKKGGKEFGFVACAM